MDQILTLNEWYFAAIGVCIAVIAGFALFRSAKTAKKKMRARGYITVLLLCAMAVLTVIGSGLIAATLLPIVVALNASGRRSNTRTQI